MTTTTNFANLSHPELHDMHEEVMRAIWQNPPAEELATLNQTIADLVEAIGYDPLEDEERPAKFESPADCQVMSLEEEKAMRERINNARPSLLMEVRRRTKCHLDRQLVVSLYQPSEAYLVESAWSWLEAVEFDYKGRASVLVVELYAGGKRIHQRQAGHPMSRLMHETIPVWLDRVMKSGQCSGVAIVFSAELFGKEQVSDLHRACKRPKWNETTSNKLVAMFTGTPIAGDFDEPEVEVEPDPIDELDKFDLKEMWMASFGYPAPNCRVEDLRILLKSKLG